MALSGMRGLSVFISDIRNCANKEAEAARVDKELANLRTRFKAERSMTPYEKKKYVWKMLYIYMLGYDVDFGHMEAVALISAPKYAEKQPSCVPSPLARAAATQVGYVVTACLLNENHDFLRLVINTVRNDIVGRHETFQCLALTMVGNVGGKEFSESLAPDVQKLLVSNSCRPLVRKKAALCLLRLFRKNQDVVNTEGWPEKMAVLLEERDLGVLTAAMSLLVALVSNSAEAYHACVPRCVRILERLTRSQDIPQDYAYYGIPSPWLQVKTMRVLQYFPAIEDPALRRSLFEVLHRILTSTDVVKNVNKNNAAHAVLFEALALIMYLDADKDMMAQCVSLLGRFIAIREPNVRYLGLETMTRMLQLVDGQDGIRRHQAQILTSLKDPDISIRRRALDLLYGMCDVSNAKEIVEELLQYLSTSDFAIREELAVKIAILSEKFAPNLSWYVDVILQLIEKAGDFVSDDIWHRVVQFVTNNEDLQAYAAREVLSYIDKPAVHETMVKAAGYILGEYSHLLSRQPGCSPKEIFAVLHDKFPTAATPTKALLLSAYAKILLHSQPPDPELQAQILSVFQKHESSVDAEVQQRAAEYVVLSTRGASMVDILAEMPKFPERQSSLLRKAEDSEGDVADISAAKLRQQAVSNALVLATPAPAANGGLPRPPLPSLVPRKDTNGYVPAQAAPLPQAPPLHSQQRPPPAPAPDLLVDLGLLALEAPTPVPPPPAGAAFDADSGLALALYDAPADSPPLGSIIDWFEALVMKDSGVLYEDAFIQIGVKAEWRGPDGRLMLYLGNKHTAGLTDVRATLVTPPSPALRIVVAPFPATIPPRSQASLVQVPIDVGVVQAQWEVPVLDFSYSYSRLVTVRLRLPVVMSKILQAAPLSGADFFARWKVLAGPPQKLQDVLRGVKPLLLPAMADLLNSLHIGVTAGLDPNPNNLVAATALTTEAGGAVYLLVRVETDPADRTQLRLTVASPDPAASLGLKNFIEEQLEERRPAAQPQLPAAAPLTGPAASLVGLL
eukprot:SM000084S23092  [mRNA]  locus=s84:17407:23674:+ [translate_table: standard]